MAKATKAVTAMDSVDWISRWRRPGMAIAAIVAVAIPVVTISLGYASTANAREAAADGVIKTDNVRSSETDSGDLVADAIRAGLGADIGIAPAASFKVGASVPRPASADQAVALVDPLTDKLSLLTLRGDKIIAALERSVSFEPQAFVGFLQLSGLKFTYDLHKESGKRVVSVTVNGQPLDASKTYKVATTHPLAIGQQGYFQIWDKSDISTESPKTIEMVIREYVKAHGGSVSPATDGRITEVEK